MSVRDIIAKGPRPEKSVVVQTTGGTYTLKGGPRVGTLSRTLLLSGDVLASKARHYQALTGDEFSPDQARLVLLVAETLVDDEADPPGWFDESEIAALFAADPVLGVQLAAAAAEVIGLNKADSDGATPVEEAAMGNPTGGD